MFGVAFIVLHFTKVEAPSNMQKRAYEDAVGYSTQVHDTPHHVGGGGGGFGQNNETQYPPANYASPGAV